jgi:hypothetical protein
MTPTTLFCAIPLILLAIGGLVGLIALAILNRYEVGPFITRRDDNWPDFPEDSYFYKGRDE